MIDFCLIKITQFEKTGLIGKVFIALGKTYRLFIIDFFAIKLTIFEKTGLIGKFVYFAGKSEKYNFIFETGSRSRFS